MLTYEEITKSEAIKTYIIRADESLGALGFTEHSFAHVMHVTQTAGYILQTMGYDERRVPARHRQSGEPEGPFPVRCRYGLEYPE